jgi:hypothetical protein
MVALLVARHHIRGLSGFPSHKDSGILMRKGNTGGRNDDAL